MDEALGYGKNAKLKVEREIQYTPEGKSSFTSASLEKSLGFPISDLESTLKPSSNKDFVWFIRLLKTLHQSNEFQQENIRLKEQLEQRQRMHQHLLRTKGFFDALPPVGAVLIGLATFILSESQSGLGTAISCGLIALLGISFTLFPIIFIKIFKSEENI